MKEQNNDEIDLIILIKQAVTILKRIYKSIIHSILIGLLFLKKNIIKLIIGSVLGGVIGYGLKVGLPSTYSSQMLVKPNFNTTTLLYNEIDFINRLLEEKDTNSHYNDLGLGENFFNIKKIEIFPLVNNKEEQTLYNRYLETIDTNLVSQIHSFEEFTANLENTDFDLHYIKVYSKKRVDFTTLSKPIVKKLNGSKYFDDFQIATIKSYKQEIASLEKIIEQYHSLQKQGTVDSNQIITPTVYIGNNESNIVDLYDRQINTRSKITDLYAKIEHNSNVLSIISNFDVYGKKIKYIRVSVSIMIGFIGTFILILLINLNNRLKTFETEHNH